MKTHRITMRLTEEQYNSLKAYADSAALPISTWARARLIAIVRKENKQINSLQV